jgi:RNA polymerase sigma-70 factor (ECF subfamily)
MMTVETSPAVPSVSTARADTSATFEQIYEGHVEFIWRSARRLGVAEGAIDDVVQQVFLVVHRRFGEFEARSSLKTWLFAILLRVVREHRRSLRRKSPHWFGLRIDVEDLAESAARSSPAEALERAEAWQILDRLLESLEGDKRVVFVMMEVEEMTAIEVSQATGLSPKAVYSRLRAARTDFERAASRMRADHPRAWRDLGTSTGNVAGSIR